MSPEEAATFNVAVSDGARGHGKARKAAARTAGTSFARHKRLISPSPLHRGGVLRIQVTRSEEPQAGRLFFRPFAFRSIPDPLDVQGIADDSRS